ncbi:MFS transporter [Pandoraea commovens]|uniref:MFS transporter n=1 Tax=Pandoraea commovens TaxID=2508289 RepID=A0ABY5QNA7_9BURK|nr:MFS transporter [Pandoraea commovens]UVA82301.1 MFS transporter [Pandoraea commovens]
MIFESLAFRWDADAVVIGLAMTFYGVPGVLAGPWIGAFVDRHCPWVMLRWSYVVRAVTAIALLLAPTLQLFLICVAMKGLANLVPGPAEQQLFRRLLSNDALAGNTSKVTLIDQMAKLFAPLVAAMLAAWHLPGFALSAALGLAGVVLLPGREVSTKPVRVNIHGRPVWAVFHTVLRDHPLLRRVFTITLCQAFVLGFYDALLALFLKARGYPDGTFGSIVGCTAAGAIIGSLAFKSAIKRCSPTTLLTVSSILFGLTVLTPAAMVFAQTEVPVFAMFSLWIGNGFGYGLGVMLVMLMFQQYCPREVLGTVTSTGRSLQLLLMIVAPLLGGALSNVTSVEFVFLCSGMTAIGLGIFARMVPVSRSPSIH